MMIQYLAFVQHIKDEKMTVCIWGECICILKSIVSIVYLPITTIFIVRRILQVYSLPFPSRGSE